MMTQNGILLIDKPEGPSSAQVVHQVKKILGAKKVGHLGTLDPFASGLLLIGVNEGTKIADIFLGGVKSYRGVMMLGIETDTQDGTGKVVLERPVPNISKSELRSLEKKFTGALQQVPPMFSALKKDGVRLYRLARQGKEIPREPRSIRIDALCLKPLSDREVEIEVTCSRGTYVRTLAADMGKELGCGAHLKNLRRVACDHLAVAQAIDIEELRKRLFDGSGPAPLPQLGVESSARRDLAEPARGSLTVGTARSARTNRQPHGRRSFRPRPRFARRARSFGEMERGYSRRPLAAIAGIP